MQPITSRDNPFFKQLVKLGKFARQRKINGQTLLDGMHLIQSYYDAELGTPTSLIISESAVKSSEILHFLENITSEQGTKKIVLSDALFLQVSPVKTPTGILALISIPKINTHSNAENAFCVMLEAIQDPGNLGSILRSAAAAGVNDVYLSSNCTDVWSPKTLRAAMGAHFLLRLHEHSNLIAIAQKLHGKIITTSLQAKKSLYQTSLIGPVTFIFGNEGTGLSADLSLVASEQIIIPMLGKTESLNVSAAAAVCLFERVRQVNTSAM